MSQSHRHRGDTARSVNAERIRLLQFAAPFQSGETERESLNIGPKLDAQRFDSEYGCMRRRGHRLGELTEAIPLREYPIRSSSSAWAIWQQLRLARYIGRRAIQIVHSYSFHSHVFAIPAAWVAGVPVIVASISDRGVHLSKAQQHVQRFICRLVDCIVVSSESLKEWLIGDGYDASNIVVIHKGINLTRFDNPRGAGLRQELGIPEHTTIVTMFEGLDPQKGVEDFIDAAAIVSWQLPDVRFLVVGEAHVSNRRTVSDDHACRRRIAERAERLGLRQRLILIGYRADVPAILSQTAVSVVPSLDEVLSNAVLESMAAGVPVVVAQGMQEAIDHGLTGLLVPPNDPQELATSMGRFLLDRDFAAAVGAAGRHVAHERFGMDRMVRAMEQLYLDLLIRKAAAPGWRCRLGLARRVLPTAGPRQ